MKKLLFILSTIIIFVLCANFSATPKTHYLYECTLVNHPELEKIFSHISSLPSDSLISRLHSRNFTVTIEGMGDRDNLVVEYSIVQDNIPYSCEPWGYFTLNEATFVLSGEPKILKKYFQRVRPLKKRKFTQQAIMLGFYDGNPTWYYYVMGDTIKFYRRWYSDGTCKDFDILYVRGDTIKRDSI